LFLFFAFSFSVFIFYFLYFFLFYVEFIIDFCYNKDIGGGINIKALKSIPPVIPKSKKIPSLPRESKS